MTIEYTDTLIVNAGRGVPVDLGDHRRPRFEFDPFKSRSNLAKHGIDFTIAQCLWDGKLVMVGERRVGNELRQAWTGIINGIYWTAVITDRNGRIRIISVRRARRYERELHSAKSES